ncbi:hypothetical protein GQ42DRAFT_117628 [Ramicandelaber brevisporus]|nr:hypothetical protein GQ42DRAFT_117628 [Ramicandelaber brevisporus]
MIATNPFKLYSGTFPSILLTLFKQCPSDPPTSRRDIVTALGFIRKSELRQPLVDRIGDFFDVDIIAGSGISSQEVSAHTCFSLLCEIVYGLRHELTAAQLQRVIVFYRDAMCRGYMDNQMLMVHIRVMNELIEPVMNLSDKQAAAWMLVYLMMTMLDRLAFLRTTLVNALSGEDRLFTKRFMPQSTAAISATTATTSTTAAAAGSESESTSAAIVSPGTTVANASDSTNSKLHIPAFPTTPADLVEVIDKFADVIISIDLSTLQEVMHLHIDTLLAATHASPPLFHFSSLLALRDVGVSQIFAAVLSKYIVPRLEDLGAMSAYDSCLMLSFFRTLLRAVIEYQQSNEPILQPHIVRIIMSALSRLRATPRPMPHLMVLRMACHSIGDDRCREMYREASSLIHFMFAELNAAYDVLTDKSALALLTDTTLAVPVRLSEIINHMTLMMRPILYSLYASPELAERGLRALEICVDNLNVDHLNPILAPAMGDLLPGIWRHVRPPPYDSRCAITAVKLFGKLGGFAQSHLRDTFVMSHIYDDFGGNPMMANVNSSSGAALHQQHAGSGSGSGSMRPHEILIKESLLAILEAVATDDTELRNHIVSKLRPVISFFAVQVVAHIRCPPSSSSVPDVDINGVETLNPHLIVDVFSDSLMCPHPTVYKTASEMATWFLDCLRSLIPDPLARSQLGIFDLLVRRSISDVYRPSIHARRAGLTGLELLLGKGTPSLDDGTSSPLLHIEWVRNHELPLIRALFHVLKNLNVPAAAAKAMANEMDIVDESECSDGADAVQCKPLRPLILLLGGELSSSSSQVRRAVQSLFVQLAARLSISVAQLLKPFADKILYPIFTKPLRTLAFSAQIGHLDALRFCMSEQPPTIISNLDDLLRMLNEATVLADTDDKALVMREVIPPDDECIAEFRLVCIQLLQVATLKLLDTTTPLRTASSGSSAESLAANLTSMRGRVVTIFLKSLHLSSPDIVAAAQAGLRAIYPDNTRMKWPKEQLQNGLRPILQNLSNARNLTPASIEGLGRLLSILANFFRPLIGPRMLNHLTGISEMGTIAQATLLDNHELQVAVSITRVAHLIQTSATLLPTLVQNVLVLEGQLKRHRSSPFREPMSLLTNQHPEETVAYFLEKLNDTSHARLFAALLEMPSASGLVLCTARTAMLLVTALASRQSPSLLPRQLPVQRKCRLRRGSLMPTTPPLCSIVASPLWISTLQRKDACCTVARHFLDLAVSLLMHCVTHEDAPYSAVAALAQLCERPILASVSVLRRHLWQNVALSPSVAKRQRIVQGALDQLAAASQTSLIGMFRYAVVPCFYAEYSRKASSSPPIFAGSAIVQRIENVIWKPLLGANSGDPRCSERLSLELVRLSILVVRNELPRQADTLRAAFRYITQLFKHDDTIIRHASFVLCAHFVAVSSASPNAIAVLVSNLLRAPQNDLRHLLFEAGDVLFPVLPERLPPPAGQPWSRAQWIQMVNGAIEERGATANQNRLLHVLSAMARYSDVFYPASAVLMPHLPNYILYMLRSMTAAGVNPNTQTTQEYRQLLCDLLTMMVRWEAMARGVMEVADELAPKKSELQLRLTAVNRKTMADDAARVERVDAAIMDVDSHSSRLFNAMRLAISPGLWPDVTMRFQLPDPTRTLSDAETIKLCNVLFVVERLLEVKGKQWLSPMAEYFVTFLRQCVKCDSQRIHERTVPIIERVGELSSGDDSAATSDAALVEMINGLFNELETIVCDSLTNPTPSFGGMTQILRALSKYRPTAIDKCAPALVSLMQKLAKEDAAAIAEATDTVRKALDLMKPIMEMLRERVSFLGDHRRYYLAALVRIVEASTNMELMGNILDTIEGWINGRRANTSLPTIREKATLMCALMMLRTNADQKLIDQYLRLVLYAYTEPSLARTDLTVRLEQAFLLGMRAKDPQIRSEFLSLLDSSLPRSLRHRLSYVIGTQNWESVSQEFWIAQALALLLRSVRSSQSEAGAVPVPAHITSGILRSLEQLVLCDDRVAHVAWIEVFASCWNSLRPRDATDAAPGLIALLAKPYHNAQEKQRPNVIQALFDGILRCRPIPMLPPHLIRTLGQKFGAHHQAILMLETYAAAPHTYGPTSSRLSSIIGDALSTIYETLGDRDMSCGLLRQHTQFVETNIALSHEQYGQWAPAQTAYERAQIMARTGALPYVETEFELWEQRWMGLLRRMQQWDVVAELSKTAGDAPRLLDSIWHMWDRWFDNLENIERLLMTHRDTATPRLRICQMLFYIMTQPDTSGELTAGSDGARVVGDLQQLLLNQWHQMPSIVTSNSHQRLIYDFQMCTEVLEATGILKRAADIDTNNLESMSGRIKVDLQNWRDRLPLDHTDFEIWSDIVAWRRHIFTEITRRYENAGILPRAGAANAGGNSSTASHQYRGPHEVAWISNRFARIARKHGLVKLCKDELAKVYRLPNIEVHEAFLKLYREAKCSLDTPYQLNAGLDVISNTNLMYFSAAQKSDFFKLKGIFLSRLGRLGEANDSFSMAVQVDTGCTNAWAAWATYNDARSTMSASTTGQIDYGAAAGASGNKHVRYLARVLFLLSIDNDAGTISEGIEAFRTSPPYRAWLMLVPQLLVALGHREAQYIRPILQGLVQQFPQEMFFQLRSAKEEYLGLRPVSVRSQQRQRAAANQSQQSTQPEGHAANTVLSNATLSEGTVGGGQNTQQTVSTQPLANDLPSPYSQQYSLPGVTNIGDVWGHVDTLYEALRSKVPLLVMMLKSIADQLSSTMRLSMDEEMHRVLSAVIPESMAAAATRLIAGNDSPVNIAQEDRNLARMISNLSSDEVRAAFERDFYSSPMTRLECVRKLCRWREHYARKMAATPRTIPLNELSHFLSELQHAKFDDVLMPGEYMRNCGSIPSLSAHASALAANVQVVHRHTGSMRRVGIRSTTGNVRYFNVQYVLVRYARREERMFQMLSILNGVLGKRVETAQRGVCFTTPAVVPLTCTMRLIGEDPSEITLHDIYGQHLTAAGFAGHSYAPLLFYLDELRTFGRTAGVLGGAIAGRNTELTNLRMDIVDQISTRFCPDSVITEYFARSLRTPSDYWCFRREFTSQLGIGALMSFAFLFNQRAPHKFGIAKSNAALTMFDLFMANIPGQPYIDDEVPFRLTPNLQHFITKVGMAGPFSSAIVSLARALTKRGDTAELEGLLQLFLRDELLLWLANAKRTTNDPRRIFEIVCANSDVITRRVAMMACRGTNSPATATGLAPNAGDPIDQPVIDLMRHAVNPMSLANMGMQWLPWF